MRNFGFVFFLLFIFVFPAFAGENVESQTEKQIIVVNDSICQKDCEIDLHTCQSDCNSHQNAWCKSDCQKTYRHCLDKCDQ